MDLHEGTIGVYSAGEGKGTRFTLELPMSRTTAVENNQSNMSRSVLEGRNQSTAQYPTSILSRTLQPFAAGSPEPPVSPLLANVFNGESVPATLNGLGYECKTDSQPVAGLRSVPASANSSVRRPMIVQHPPASVCGGGRHDPTFSEGDIHPPSPSSNDIAFPPGNGRKGSLMLRELSRRDVMNPQSGSVTYSAISGKRKGLNKRGVYLGSPIMSRDNFRSRSRSRSPDVSAAIMQDVAVVGVRSPSASVVSSVAGSASVVAPVSVAEQSAIDPASPKWDILVVDDSPLNRKMLMKTLRAAGHRCEEAGNGREGVDMVQRRVDNSAALYDVILMDFVMPEMNGPTATKVHIPYTQHGTLITHPLTTFLLTALLTINAP